MRKQKCKIVRWVSAKIHKIDKPLTTLSKGKRWYKVLIHPMTEKEFSVYGHWKDNQDKSWTTLRQTWEFIWMDVFWKINCKI